MAAEALGNGRRDESGEMAGVAGGRKKGLEDLDMLSVEPWSRLRLGILLRAIYDYRMCSEPAIRSMPCGNLIELRAFFRSGWCELLLDGIENITGEEILEFLEEEAKKECSESF